MKEYNFPVIILTLITRSTTKEQIVLDHVPIRSLIATSSTGEFQLLPQHINTIALLQRCNLQVEILEKSSRDVQNKQENLQNIDSKNINIKEDKYTIQQSSYNISGGVLQLSKIPHKVDKREEISYPLHHDSTDSFCTVIVDLAEMNN